MEACLVNEDLVRLARLLESGTVLSQALRDRIRLFAFPFLMDPSLSSIAGQVICICIAHRKDDQENYVRQLVYAISQMMKLSVPDPAQVSHELYESVAVSGSCSEEFVLTRLMEALASAMRFAQLWTLTWAIDLFNQEILSISDPQVFQALTRLILAVADAHCIELQSIVSAFVRLLDSESRLLDPKLVLQLGQRLLPFPAGNCYVSDALLKGFVMKVVSLGCSKYSSQETCSMPLLSSSKKRKSDSDELPVHPVTKIDFGILEETLRFISSCSLVVGDLLDIEMQTKMLRFVVMVLESADIPDFCCLQALQTLKSSVIAFHRVFSCPSLSSHVVQVFSKLLNHKNCEIRLVCFEGIAVCNLRNLPRRGFLSDDSRPSIVFGEADEKDARNTEESDAYEAELSQVRASTEECDSKMDLDAIDQPQLAAAEEESDVPSEFLQSSISSKELMQDLMSIVESPMRTAIASEFHSAPHSPDKKLESDRSAQPLQSIALVEAKPDSDDDSPLWQF